MSSPHGLRQQYEKSGDPDIGVVNDFTHIMVYSLRGDVDALIATGRHMMATFPPPETVIDPLHFFHPRVYCWMALGEAVRGDMDAHARIPPAAMDLAQSRGDMFNILAAKLTSVECAAILGIVEGTVELADGVDREFCAAGGHQWGAAARIIRVWAQTLETGDGDRGTVAFEAFEVFASDGSTAMPRCFSACWPISRRTMGASTVPANCSTGPAALADATGEHASDRFIAQRVAALSSLTDQSA